MNVNLGTVAGIAAVAAIALAAVWRYAERSARDGRTVGKGSAALLLALAGLLFAWCSDPLLELLGAPVWIDLSDHSSYRLPFLLSSLFFVPGLLLGGKYKQHIGADWGWRISGLFTFLIGFSSIGLLIFPLFRS